MKDGEVPTVDEISLLSIVGGSRSNCSSASEARLGECKNCVELSHTVAHGVSLLGRTDTSGVLRLPRVLAGYHVTVTTIKNGLHVVATEPTAETQCHNIRSMSKPIPVQISTGSWCIITEHVALVVTLETALPSQ